MVFQAQQKLLCLFLFLSSRYDIMGAKGGFSMKKCLLFILTFALILILAACGEDSPAELHLSDYDLSATTEIRMQNAHNGHFTIIMDPNDIAAITEFIQEVVGTAPESGKGYYEGTYSLQFYRGEEEIISMAFGDSDCFFTGKGDDGYPLRYHLPDNTIQEQVIPFLSQFDQSGFEWN